MKTKLKLPKAPKQEGVERLAVGVKTSTLTMLKHYQEAYTASYGEQISMGNLVEDMLKSFMSQDKEFMKYHQSRNGGATAAATPTEG